MDTIENKDLESIVEDTPSTQKDPNVTYYDVISPNTYLSALDPAYPQQYYKKVRKMEMPMSWFPSGVYGLWDQSTETMYVPDPRECKINDQIRNGADVHEYFHSTGDLNETTTDGKQMAATGRPLRSFGRFNYLTWT